MAQHDEPAASFDTAFRGYDRDQVDASIADLHEQIRSLQAQNDELQLRLDQIEGNEEKLRSLLLSAQRFTDQAREEAEAERHRARKQTRALKEQLEREAREHRQQLEQGLQGIMERYARAVKDVKYVFNSGLVFVEQLESKYQKLSERTQTQVDAGDETRFAILDDDAAPAATPSTSPERSTAEAADELLRKLDRHEQQQPEPESDVAPHSDADPAEPHANDATDTDNDFRLYRGKLTRKDDHEPDESYSEEELDQFLQSLREGSDDKR